MKLPSNTQRDTHLSLKEECRQVQARDVPGSEERRGPAGLQAPVSLSPTLTSPETLRLRSLVPGLLLLILGSRAEDKASEP